MTWKFRRRTVLAAIATAAIAATAGCSQGAGLLASAEGPVAATVHASSPVLAKLDRPGKHHKKAHGKKSTRHHHPTPSPTGTTPAPSPTATGGPGNPTSAPTTPAPAPTTQSPAPSPTPTSPSPSSNPTTPPPPPPGANCSTSAQKGECGPYSDAQIEGLGSGNQDKIQIGNNMWADVAGASSTLYTTAPDNWRVVANVPAGNTSVVSYPSLAADFHLETSSGSWYEQPLTNFTSLTSSFSENMNANSGTSAWAAYDIWLNGGSNEVMIQHDFANNGACTAIATATFGGSNGVPVQPWHLCKFGSEQVWKLGTDDNHKINEQSGRVDILGMLTWMENHGDLPANSTIGLLGYGWEICSTGGQSETFQDTGFTITATKS